jgi:hypothetical protein
MYDSCDSCKAVTAYLSEVRLLPLLLLMSDMGDMQEERPEMLEIPESEWEWLCFGLGDTFPSPHVDSTAKTRNVKHVSFILISNLQYCLFFMCGRG